MITLSIITSTDLSIFPCNKNAGFGVDVQSEPPPDPTPQLTAEQLERIRKNREMALAKREAAMRARLQQHQLEQLEGE